MYVTFFLYLCSYPTFPPPPSSPSHLHGAYTYIFACTHHACTHTHILTYTCTLAHKSSTLFLRLSFNYFISFYSCESRSCRSSLEKRAFWQKRPLSKSNGRKPPAQPFKCKSISSERRSGRHAGKKINNSENPFLGEGRREGLFFFFWNQ